jgi:acetyl-CoA acyltransferase
MSSTIDREAVIVGAVRSPIGRRGGALESVHPVELLAGVLDELVTRTGCDPERVDDHISGCVSQTGEQSSNVARNAWLAAGLPETVPATTVDRQCGSSLQAIHFAAQGVMSGSYDLAIASGVESMTRVPMGSPVAGADPYGRTLRERFEGRLVPQSISAELVASRWSITRDELDDFGWRSHVRAGQAVREGRFDREIVSVHLSDDGRERVVTSDEGVRMEPDRARMGQLPPAFRDETWEQVFGGELRWVVTAGNASQISDGAAATLIASRDSAERMGLRARARIRTMTLAGASPVLMLSATIPATRKALDRSGLAVDDFDVIEINEAFASAVLAWKKELRVPDRWFDDHVNPNGGAIALGHPLGAAGCRLMTTMVHELERSGGRFGLEVICEGGGMANAIVVERIA